MGGRPSVTSHGASSAEPGLEGAGSGAAVDVENPQEIGSVGSVFRMDKNIADTSRSERATVLASQPGGDAGPSEAKPNVGSGIAGAAAGSVIVEEGYSNHRLNEQSGAQGISGGDENSEGDPRVRGHESSLQGTVAGDAVVEAGGGGTAMAEEDQQRRLPPAVNPNPVLDNNNKPRDSHHIDIPPRDRSSKVEELDSYKGIPVVRTTSNFSVESAAGDQCRICQQHADEPLMDLGCHCRGELAKAHQSCVNHWFGTKGTNKCEVCQHVATNVPAPSTQPAPHFWVWRVGGPYNGATLRRAAGVGPIRFSPLPVRPVLLMTLRRHPTIMLLWVLLFAFMAYLFVDVTDSASIGYAAMPIGFLFGVLVVLGLGTAARLILECWHERVIRRNIQRMEEATYEDFVMEQNNNISGPSATEGQAPPQGTPSPPPAVLPFSASPAPPQHFPPPRPATPPPSPPPPPAPRPQTVPAALEVHGGEIGEQNGAGGAAPPRAEGLPSGGKVAVK